MVAPTVRLQAQAAQQPPPPAGAVANTDRVNWNGRWITDKILEWKEIILVIATVLCYFFPKGLPLLVGVVTGYALHWVISAVAEMPREPTAVAAPPPPQ